MYQMLRRVYAFEVLKVVKILASRAMQMLRTHRHRNKHRQAGRQADRQAGRQADTPSRHTDCDDSGREKQVTSYLFYEMSSGGEGSTQNGLDINFPINSKYSKMLEMLKKVRANTSTMTRDRLRETVHILLQRLLESKVEALRAVERAKGLQLQLNALQGKSSPTPDTQTAAPGATTPAAPGATNTA